MGKVAFIQNSSNGNMKKLLILIALSSTSAFAGKFSGSSSSSNSSYNSYSTHKVQEEIEKLNEEYRIKNKPIELKYEEPQKDLLQLQQPKVITPYCANTATGNFDECVKESESANFSSKEWRYITKNKNSIDFYAKRNSIFQNEKSVFITFKYDGNNNNIWRASIWKRSCFNGDGNLYIYDSKWNYVLTSKYVVNDGTEQAVIANELCEAYKQTLK